jgi:predicted NodU family carbamoyl transferase
MNQTAGSRWVLGLNTGSDAAIVLCNQGKLVAGAYEAQFPSVSTESELPISAIRWVLCSQGLTLADIDAIVLPNRPTTEWQQIRLSAASAPLHRWPAAASRLAVLAAHQRITARSLARRLARLGSWVESAQLPRLVHCPTELSYVAIAISAASAESGAYAFIGGAADSPGLCVGTFEPGSIQQLRSAEGSSALGRFIAAVLAYLGLNSAASLRSLAAFSSPESERVGQLVLTLRERILTCHRDGSVSLQPSYFSAVSYCRSAWVAALRVSPREPLQSLTLDHADLACAALDLISERFRALADYARRLTERSHLVLAGPLLEFAPSIDPAVEPLALTNGWNRALSAALAYAGTVHHSPHRPQAIEVQTILPTAGPALLDSAVESLARSSGHDCTRYASADALYRAAALKLSGGESLSWCDTQVRPGQPPELLRGVLIDPRRAERIAKLTAQLGAPRHPFTALLRIERASDYFELTHPRVSVLTRAALQHRWRKRKPSDWISLSLAQRAASSLSTWPGVVGPDYHAELLLISADSHPELWALLATFERVADCPMLAVAPLVQAPSRRSILRQVPYTAADALGASVQLQVEHLLIGSLLVRIRSGVESTPTTPRP